MNQLHHAASSTGTSFLPGIGNALPASCAKPASLLPSADVPKNESNDAWNEKRPCRLNQVAAAGPELWRPKCEPPPFCWATLS
jgi:hypothetical protein